MRTVSLFIAMSLNGYIADRDGGVGWLGGQDPDGEMVDSYAAFVKDVDTVVMGWNTYHQIVTELSPTEWVYGGLTSYVITHRAASGAEGIIFTDRDPCGLVKELKQGPGAKIWICGGADIAGQLLREDLIDEFYISVIPVILGEGIRLFEKGGRNIALKLTGTQSYNGITDLIYTRR